MGRYVITARLLGDCIKTGGRLLCSAQDDEISTKRLANLWRTTLALLGGNGCSILLELKRPSNHDIRPSLMKSRVTSLE